MKEVIFAMPTSSAREFAPVLFKLGLKVKVGLEELVYETSLRFYSQILTNIGFYVLDLRMDEKYI